MAGLSWLVMVGEVVARADQSAGQLAVTCRADQVTHLALGPNLFAWPTGEAAEAGEVAGDSTAPEYRYRYSYRYRYRYRYRYIYSTYADTETGYRWVSFF